MNKQRGGFRFGVKLNETQERAPVLLLWPCIHQLSHASLEQNESQCLEGTRQANGKHCIGKRLERTERKHLHDCIRALSPPACTRVHLVLQYRFGLLILSQCMAGEESLPLKNGDEKEGCKSQVPTAWSMVETMCRPRQVWLATGPVSYLRAAHVTP